MHPREKAMNDDVAFARRNRHFAITQTQRVNRLEFTSKCSEHRRDVTARTLGPWIDVERDVESSAGHGSLYYAAHYAATLKTQRGPTQFAPDRPPISLEVIASMRKPCFNQRLETKRSKWPLVNCCLLSMYSTDTSLCAAKPHRLPRLANFWQKSEAEASSQPTAVPMRPSSCLPDTLDKFRPLRDSQQPSSRTPNSRPDGKAQQFLPRCRIALSSDTPRPVMDGIVNRWPIWMRFGSGPTTCLFES